MQNFLLSVSASLFAGILLIIIVSKTSDKAKWVLIGILGRLTNSDLDFVYENKKASISEIEKEIKRANEIFIYASRGNELHRETFESIFMNKPKGRKVIIKILLPDSLKKADSNDWISQRENELKKFDKSHGNGLFRSQITSNIEFLKCYVESNELELRLYDYPHTGRILITDKFLYFTPYSKETHGRNNSVYKFKRGGEMYSNMKRYFFQIWEKSRQMPLKELYE
ncbi:MAG: hypothetical protein KAS53_09470 [Candidatus Cloacimonetes bacterium]|nr:hypothetical protein [Candidatus Cloacimonadota bacterium]